MHKTSPISRDKATFISDENLQRLDDLPAVLSELREEVAGHQFTERLLANSGYDSPKSVRDLLRWDQNYRSTHGRSVDSLFRLGAAAKVVHELGRCFTLSGSKLKLDKFFASDSMTAADQSLFVVDPTLQAENPGWRDLDRFVRSTTLPDMALAAKEVQKVESASKMKPVTVQDIDPGLRILRTWRANLESVATAGDLLQGPSGDGSADPLGTKVRAAVSETVGIGFSVAFEMTDAITIPLAMDLIDAVGTVAPQRVEGFRGLEESERGFLVRHLANDLATKLFTPGHNPWDDVSDALAGQDDIWMERAFKSDDGLTSAP